MKPYYQDESVTLYHGDSLEVLPTLDIKSNVLLTDPPYFKVKKDEWDNQWDKAHEFLEWMGEFLDHAKPLLVANASVWVFASPAMTSSVERLIAERFRVLNSIRWVKEAGWHQKIKVSSLRSYLTAWEGIVFAETTEVINTVGDYIRSERVAAGLSTNDLEVALGFVESRRPGVGTRLCGRWEEGSSLPRRETYDRMGAVVPGFFRRTHESLVAEHASTRRPFSIAHRSASTDVWGFASVPWYPGKHSCEKPQAMLRHMIETSSRPGDLILDPFAGGGSTLDAARQTGRRAIGIEKDEEWCEKIATRLSK